MFGSAFRWPVRCDKALRPTGTRGSFPGGCERTSGASAIRSLPGRSPQETRMAEQVAPPQAVRLATETECPLQPAAPHPERCLRLGASDEVKGRSRGHTGSCAYRSADQRSCFGVPSPTQTMSAAAVPDAARPALEKLVAHISVLAPLEDAQKEAGPYTRVLGRVVPRWRSRPEQTAD